MNRQKRRETHTYTGAQLERIIEHNVNEGFQQGKIVTIGKMTEIYSVAAAYAIHESAGLSEEKTKELVDQVLATFTKFSNGEIDYDQAKQVVEDRLGLKFAMMPEDVKIAAAPEQP